MYDVHRGIVSEKMYIAVLRAESVHSGTYKFFWVYIEVLYIYIYITSSTYNGVRCPFHSFDLFQAKYRILIFLSNHFLELGQNLKSFRRKQRYKFCILGDFAITQVGRRHIFLEYVIYIYGYRYVQAKIIFRVHSGIFHLFQYVHSGIFVSFLFAWSNNFMDQCIIKHKRCLIWMQVAEGF